MGFCLVKEKPEIIEILDFMLSCRVQSKFIEQALFSHLMENHNSIGARAVWVTCRRTMSSCAIGFRPCDAVRDGIASGMILQVEGPLSCNFIEVRCSAGTTGAVT